MTALNLLPECMTVMLLAVAIFMVKIIGFLLKFGVKKWNSTVSRI